jgi:uncharacterized membrane protein
MRCAPCNGCAAAPRALLCIGAIVTSIYAVVVYAALPLGQRLHPDMRRSFEQRRVAIYLHVFASALALAAGSLQVLDARRAARHRWVGRLYVASVLVGGVSGVVVGAHAFGGAVSAAGFMTLGVLWVASSLAGLWFIRTGQREQHRQWMMRSYALAFAAVTLRLQLGPCLAAGVPLERFYPALAWTSWVPNLIFVEWWMRRGSVAQPMLSAVGVADVASAPLSDLAPVGDTEAAPVPSVSV